MSNRFLQRVFLLCALLFFSFSGVQALKVWHNETIFHNTHSAFDEDVSIDGTITVSKDVYISARLTDVTVSITTDNVIIEPAVFLDQNATTTGFGHLIFHAKSGRAITVDCDYDIQFYGNTGSFFGATWYEDMIVTFSGQGTTTFKLKETDIGWGWRGAQVAFDGEQISGFADPGETPESIIRYGTRAYIIMDQTEAQAITNGINKVVFERQNLAGGGLPTGVHIGPGSFLTYLSTNATGWSEDPYASTIYDPEEGAYTNTYGWGSIAFDPSNSGAGRMYLRLAQNINQNTAFGDGGIMVFGHFVDGFEESDIRNEVYLNAVAGRKALFRVTDGLRYAGDTDPADAATRGLLVINEVKHMPSMANDPYQERNLWGINGGATPQHADGAHPSKHAGADFFYWATDYAWRHARTCYYSHDAFLNVQPGFILGTNGRLDIYHRTFFDYVACQSQTMDFMASGDYSTYRGLGYAAQLATSSVLKFRNTSAFHVDGINKYSNYNDSPGPVTDTYYSPYDYSSGAEINPNAEIFMYGDAKALFRTGKAPEGDPSPSDGNRDSNYGPWYDSEVLHYVYTFSIDRQPYNAQYIPSDNVTTGEGRNVIDIEGPLLVRKFIRDDAPARDYGITGESLDEGVINLPTVSIDHTGREYDYPTTAYIDRPLTKSTSYQIYDSPSVFLNDHVELYNVIYANADITKLLNTSTSNAFPNFVGGERKYFGDTVFPADAVDTNLYDHYLLPQWRLYNSRHDLHEHFVAAGCRFVVREQTVDKDGEALYGTDANNTSAIKCYDHGDQLDTLDHAYGRLFMASCSNNKMSNDSTNATTEACTINIYRKNQISSPNLPAQMIKLSLQSADDGGLPVMEHLVDTTDRERAHHLILLNRASNGVGLVDVGWTTTYGDNTKYPWEAITLLGSNYFDINVTTSGDPNVGLTNTPPATISIDGNYFYFGGTDWMGNKCIVPVTATGQGSVVYINHGARITATQPAGIDSIHGYDAFIDLPIAYRLWSYDGLRGIIDLPKDQVMYGYGYGRQPYNVNTVLTDAGSPIGVHLDTYNGSKVDGYSGRISADRYSGEEYVLAWRHRVDQNTPVKTPLKAMLTRYTGIIDQPVTMPANVVYFGAGDGWADVVTQLKVAGATIADPMHLLIDGYASGPGYAWVKEIVSIASNPSVHGEGDHGIIFLRNGGRVGLGNYSWNAHSSNSWKLLGKDYLTISPVNNGTIDLNSDVYIVDRGAFVAEDSFGDTEVNRLTINLNGNDFYVPAGGELDLSSFGQNTYRQEIEFAGEGRVILGHGAVIRFPSSITPADASNAPVLYFNDNTKLVIEDDPEFGKGKYTTLTAADVDKVKIFGIGQIWLNKDARFEIMGGGKVRVGSDIDTPYTWVRISIQRQGDWVIGDEQERGGSFEVGNPSIVTGRESEEGTVSFELILNGAKARTHLDRGAFMGFGVGIIDKSSDVMNGASTLALNPVVNAVTGDVNFSPDTTDAWKIQALYDVWKINIYNYQGIFDHSNILNGSNRKSSMLAIGPVYEYDGQEGGYRLELIDPDRSRILAGGNVLLLNEEVTTWINTWDFADPVARETWQTPAEDYGMYNMLAADMIIQQQKPANFPNSIVEELAGGGIRIQSETIPLVANASKDFFDFISTPKYANLDGKMVNCGATQYRTYIGYVNTAQPSNNYSAANADQIYRLTGISVIGNGRPEDGTEIGVLGSTGAEEPVVYTIVNRR